MFMAEFEEIGKVERESRNEMEDCFVCSEIDEIKKEKTYGIGLKSDVEWKYKSRRVKSC